jgi:uncharacterized repeat protein (TIGR01451 family)
MESTKTRKGFGRLSRTRSGGRRPRIALAAGLAMLLAITGEVWGATPVHAAVVLSVSQTVSSPAIVGQNLTFTVTMTNAGTDTVSEGIDDNTPVGAGASFVSLKSTSLSCAGTHGNELIICQPVQLAPGASASYDLTIRPTAPGTTGNSASADPNFNYYSQVTVEVSPAPTDVQVTGSASTGSPARGASFSYTFQVKDNGPWSVGDVTFSDPLPSQVTFLGVSTSNGSTCAQSSGTVSCDLGGLNVGQQVNVVITVLAPAAPSAFTNTATVTPSVGDTQPSNNSVGVTVQVK